MKSAKSEGLALRAAVYARKSTDDSDRDAINKSVVRQVEHARAYAAKKGWTIDPEHVYVDDNVSGAEFKNRPALLRLLNAVKSFDVVIMSELSRIGRDQIQVAQCLANIEAANVEVWFYMTDEKLRFESAVDRFLVNAVSFAAELEREKASQRSRDALERKAKAGYNAGGLVFGYRNVPVIGANGVKSHTEYAIDEQQAEVVRTLYRMYADGHGGRVIAYCVNGDPAHRALLKRYFGVRPQAPRGGKNWSANTIKCILRNPRYFGLIPYGKWRKKYVQGTQRRVPNHEELFPAPHLRIIDEKLEAAVKQRIERMATVYLRSTDGKLHGRPSSGAASRYLLSGLVRCEECGSAMIATSSYTGSGKTRRQVRQYACSGRTNRGPSTCSNGLRPRLDALDSEVLRAIEHHISPAAIRAAAKLAAATLRAKRKAQPDKAKKLRDDLTAAEAEVQRFVAAIGSGGKIESLVSALRAAEQRRDALRGELAATESPAVLDVLGNEKLETKLLQRAKQWQKVLAGDVLLARQALGALLAGPVLIRPEGDGYKLTGATRIGALWQPDVGLVKMASPRGFEPRLPP